MIIRYSDGLWNHQTKPDYSPFIDGLRHGVHGSRAKRIIFEDSNNTQESQLKLFGNHDDLSRDNQTDSKTQVDAIDKDIIVNDQRKVALKRKAINQQEPENRDLDLNLSLQIKTREDYDIRNNEVNESGLALSLFSSMSSNTPSNIRSSKHAKIMEGSSSCSNTTLDLTL